MPCPEMLRHFPLPTLARDVFDHHVLSRRAVVGAALALFGGGTLAHEYWIDRSGDTYVLHQGHVYSKHEGEARVPYDPAIVKRVACAQDGSIIAPEVVRAYPVRVTARCAAILVQMSSGYWTQTLMETVPKPRSEVRGAIRGWRSEEVVKRIDRWMPNIAQPLSDGLEIMPMEDPFQLKPGDKLRLLVTWQGKPRGGVAVAYAGNARGVTGADGQANIRIRRGGVQVLSASFDEAIRDPLADKVVRETILQFELPQ